MRHARPRIIKRTKLNIRLLPEINDALRQQLNYHGDLSRLISEALDGFRLSDPRRQIPDMRKLLSGRREIPATSVSVSAETRAKLRSVANSAKSRRNAVVNGAIAQFLRFKLS